MAQLRMRLDDGKSFVTVRFNIAASLLMAHLSEDEAKGGRPILCVPLYKWPLSELRQELALKSFTYVKKGPDAFEWQMAISANGKQTKHPICICVIAKPEGTTLTVAVYEYNTESFKLPGKPAEILEVPVIP